MSNKSKYVIIGNSGAAIHAVKGIRRLDPEGTITLISAEDCPAYSPVLLTYYVSGKITRDEVFIVHSDFYEAQRVVCMLGKRASGIDPEQHVVHLGNGTKIGYEKLLIATGSSAKRLGVPGENTKGVYTLKTIDDADRLLEAARSAKDVVIVGGGLIGLQALNALTGDGRNLTLVVGSKRVLSRNVDYSCAEKVCDGVKECGASVFFESQVTAIDPDGDRLCVALESGEKLVTDAVVVGKGVKPNLDVLGESHITTGIGIIVDETMRTKHRDIFAAGDVAEGKNAITGKHQAVTTWSNACGQGSTAGINMAGGHREHYGLGWNICNFLGKRVSSIGITESDGDTHQETVFEDRRKGIYRKIVWNERDEIVGAVIMGQMQDVGVINGFIRNRIKIPDSIKGRILHSPRTYGDFFADKTRKVLR
jgi:NAD(P)H-nitrite reductase large subunit